MNKNLKDTTVATRQQEESCFDQKSEQRGASLVEYALLLVLVLLACYAAVQSLGGKTSAKLSEVTKGL